MSDEAEQGKSDNLEIAIIGMASRFPGARNSAEFWENLQKGIESITFFSRQELEAEGISVALLDDPCYVKAAGILDDVALFDASFFGYSPREAEIMDPQHRIFLECAWEALEHAGYDPEEYHGQIGVYAGSGSSVQQYLNYLSAACNDVKTLIDAFQLGIANDKDFLATRVSYKLNLQGSSFTVQTACSTSLVAIHLACQSLLSGDCDMALAGGVSLNIPQKQGYLYQKESILSPDGHCRAFDAQAQGTVRGSGAGIVVMKRLEDALQDKDTIHAIIKGSAVNNDGALKVGYTAPSIDGQVNVIQAAQLAAGVEPDTISYIEAHGTGTSLGDPIEFAALKQVFESKFWEKGRCAIGSAKANIGHLDASAGIAGLIKTIQALQHRCIPPLLHFVEPNPQLELANSPFYFNKESIAWNPSFIPRRAGVSSFGIGGTNAHIILEEAPEQTPSLHQDTWHLLAISAKTSTALEKATTNLAAYCKRQVEYNLADMAYTLQVGRRSFEYRRFLVCHTLDQAIQALEIGHPTPLFTSFQRLHSRPVAFLFPGGGSQYVNMGRDLYRDESVFREQIDLCATLLHAQSGIDIHAVLYPPEMEAATKQMQSTRLGLPALFAVEYALAKVWMARGIVPQAMLGHSLGEYVAASLAGVFSLEDALAIVALRGKLLETLPHGAMLSISLDEQEIRALLDDRFSIAAINGPSSCVVSGSSEAIEELSSQLNEKVIAFQRVRVDVAAHSHMVIPIIDTFTAFLATKLLHAPQIPFVSNLTGDWITAKEATDPGYWGKHLRHTVCFAAGVHTLWENPDLVLLEVGPGRTLSHLVQLQGYEDRQQDSIASMRHIHEKQSDQAFLLTALGMLWLRGVSIDWEKLHEHGSCRRLPLPTYPFERQRYWISPSQTLSNTLKEDAGSVLKKADIADWFYVPLWRQTIPPATVEQAGKARQKSYWLVLQDEGGIGVNLEKRLREVGDEVISVVKGASFAKVSATTYCLNPAVREEYDYLIKNLISENVVPQNIVHLWTIDQRISDSLVNDEQWNNWQDRSFYSLIFLAQALGERAKTSPIQLWVISSNLQKVTGSEELHPEKATIVGPCKVIPQEYPHITCHSIDIIVPVIGTWQEERLVSQLINEMRDESAPHTIAYREDHRWIQIFEAMRIERRDQRAVSLRDEGVYLITGGLGGIGLVFAEYLVQQTRARLILIGRSTFPAAAEWEAWLKTHEEQDQVSQKIRKLRQLEEMGGKIQLFSADVANYERMQEIINYAKIQFGHIHGVIHAAGIAGGGIIQLKTREAAERVFAPKVKGALHLMTLLKDEELDFLVFCSSLNAITGGFGLVDYCSANAVLDALVSCHRYVKDATVLSINWDTWRDVGMTVDTPVPLQWQLLREEGLRQGISSGEGVDAFGRLLHSRLHQVLVSTKNIDVQLRFYHERMNAASSLERVEQKKLSSHQRPNLATQYVAPRNEIEQTIANSIQDILGFAVVGIYDNFLQMGGDSLLALQLVSLLHKTFQLDIRLSTIFEAPNVADLAQIIEELLISKIEEIPEEIAQFLAQQ